MKVTISRLFELSRYLNTNAGKDLEGALSYLSDFAELTIRGLRNNLTFEDNLFCDVKRVNVRNGVESIVSVASKKRPTRILVDRAISKYYIITGFGWRFNAAGEVVVTIKFDGSPPANESIPVDLTIFYGA